MIQAITYWLLVQFDVIQLWHIAALAFFLGVVNTINQTARQSLVNSLVPRDELLNAIGLQSSVFNFSKILGPSVGGVIIAYIGIAGCFLVNAISFIYLLFNLYQMDLPTWEKRSDEKSMWTDVKEGFSYLSGNRRLLYIVGLSYVVATFVAPYNRFVPIFATNVLHVGASGFGLLMSAPGVGATVAALVLASVNKLRVGVRSICAEAQVDVGATRVVRVPLDLDRKFGVGAYRVGGFFQQGHRIWQDFCRAMEEVHFLLQLDLRRREDHVRRRRALVEHQIRRNVLARFEGDLGRRSQVAVRFGRDGRLAGWDVPEAEGAFGVRLQR